MNGPRHQLLPGSAFAGDEHAGDSFGRSAHLFAQVEHGPTAANQLLEEPCLGAQLERRLLGPHQAQGVVQHHQQAIGRDGFLQEIQGAEPCRAHRRVDGRVSAHHDDRRLDASRAQTLEQLDAVAVRQRDVEQQHVVALLRDALRRQRHATGDIDRVALQRERLLERAQDGWLVVDDQDLTARHQGKTLPTPERDAKGSRVSAVGSRFQADSQEDREAGRDFESKPPRPSDTASVEVDEQAGPQAPITRQNAPRTFPPSREEPSGIRGGQRVGPGSQFSRQLPRRSRSA